MHGVTLRMMEQYLYHCVPVCMDLVRGVNDHDDVSDSQVRVITWRKVRGS